MTDRLARVPAWAWLAGIVGLSWLLRLWLVRGMAAPFIFVDELIYTELARSLADTGSFAVRGTAVSGYSILYPALLAPVYGAFDNLVDAYAAAKATNAIVMSLAAIPTYLLARRVAGERLALLGAAIAVVVPSMAYTGTITTESLFYPVALGLALVLVRYLERPGWPWLAALVAALAIAFATRSQSLAFVPAIATAPLLLALLRSRWSALRPFVPLYALGAAAAIGLVVLQAARGRSLDRPARRLQHRGRGRVRRRPGAAVLAVARRGARPLRRDRALRGAPARAAGRPHPPRPAPGARRGDDGARRLVDARGRRLRVALRVGPHPGSVPVLPRAAPRRRRARLGRARRSTASRPNRSPPRRSRWRWCWSSRTSGSSASPRSRTRSGWSRCGRSTSTSSPGATGRRSPSPASRCSRSTCSSPRGTPSPCRSSSSRSSPSSPGRSGRARTASWRRESARCGRAIPASRATGSTARCRPGTRSRCSGPAAPTASRST